MMPCLLYRSASDFADFAEDSLSLVANIKYDMPRHECNWSAIQIGVAS